EGWGGGGRSGGGTGDLLLAVASAAVAAPGVEPAGVAGYEGPHKDANGVWEFLRELRSDAAALSAEHGLDRPVLSVGGSAWFDLVAEELGGAKDVLPILRSGAYVTHDDGLYRRTTPYRRMPEGPDTLAGALELWTQITSVPEEGLAIAAMGRREANEDQGYLIPSSMWREEGGVARAPGG